MALAIYTFYASKKLPTAAIKNNTPAISNIKPDAAPPAFNPYLNTIARRGDVKRVAAIRRTASAEKNGATSTGWTNDVPYDCMENGYPKEKVKRISAVCHQSRCRIHGEFAGKLTYDQEEWFRGQS